MSTPANSLNISQSGLVKFTGTAFTGVTTTAHDVLIGAASNGITNVAPSAASGIALISQGVSADPTFGTVTVPGGGTGAATLTGVLIGNGTSPISGNAITQFDVLVGGSSNAISSVGPGSSGQVLQSAGNAANPAYSTATYPATATGTGTILRADGTNWAATTSTYPNTNAANTLLYASSANVMAALATANNGVLTTGTGGAPAITALATNGQLIIGSSSGAPAAATLTAGSNVTITNAANSITIAATSSGSSGTLLTPTATTSGSSVTFSGLSSVQANVTYFMFADVGRTTTDVLKLQVGPASALKTTGYDGITSTIVNTTLSTTTWTTSILIGTSGVAAADLHSGTVIITLLDATNFIYSIAGTVGTSGTITYTYGGTVTLTGLLDQFKLFLGGAATFNSGKVNVLYYT
jgi:hypothetical protein